MKIQELAYQKWEAAGCPQTTEEQRNRFWYEAEQELKQKKEEDIHINRWNIKDIR